MSRRIFNERDQRQRAAEVHEASKSAHWVLWRALCVTGSAWAATDTTISPNVMTPAGTAATPATPTQATATYTFSYVHAGQPATAQFTYNFATQTWQPPSGWSQTAGTPAGVSEFTIYNASAGTADKIVITGAPSITNTPTTGSGAMANIPMLTDNKSVSVGVGLGNYNGQSAVALGANFRVSAAAQIRASLATGSSGGKTAVGLGASASW